jgi:putative phosphoesterase
LRVGLVGDIHGNDRALRAVLDAAGRADVDRLLVSGDLVGYYFGPRKVLDLLNSWQCTIVRGNHEAMLAIARGDPQYLAEVDARYGSGLRIAISELGLDQLDFLCGLPHPLVVEIDGMRILLCHGSPWDFDHYIYPDADSSLLARCALSNFDLVVMGHTHYPMLRKVGNATLVNPGSVGQARNRQPGAAWALLDTEDRSITFHRESYDHFGLAAECTARHPELPYLAEVLSRT